MGFFQKLKQFIGDVIWRGKVKLREANTDKDPTHCHISNPKGTHKSTISAMVRRIKKIFQKKRPVEVDPPFFNVNNEWKKGKRGL